MNKQLILDFAQAINQHDVEKIYSLMSQDFKFVDAHGNEITGKDKMKSGWTGYFNWFPDYKIEIEDIISNGDTIAAFGFASGTYKGLKTAKNKNYWRLPASWKAVVADNKVTLWQVYADTKIPFDIIQQNK